MRQYIPNSPKAAARVLVMNIIANAKLDHAELDFIQKLRIPDKLGLSEASFVQVLQDYCADLLADPRREKIRPADPALVDPILDEITNPALQQKIADFAFLLSHADDSFCQIEQAVYRRMLSRWNMDLSGSQVFTHEAVGALGQAREAAKRHAKRIVKRINQLEQQPPTAGATAL
jgi:hypothetical protein